ncbi:VanZ family protein [Microbacterium sp. NC79]|uniref:VanZ family protein n=1 Tax=Microbacterium sp. NC79 TaxID=2851009 RepID=UPI001C2B9873|nr:VanZ family protein [Microbacterium sp. NC79]MBV0894060.1 VanZ family protein [Microbacterium sp. NC79]
MTDAITQSLPGTRRAPNGGPRPPQSHLRVWIAWLGLLAYGAVVAVVTLSPTPLDSGYRGAIDKVLAVLHRNGLPERIDYPEVEFAANILMFIPIGFFIGLVLPRMAVWAGILVLPALSGAIEFIQGQLLAERFATVNDMIANTIGGWTGLLAAILIRAIVHARDVKVIARATWDQRHDGGRSAQLHAR